MTSIFTDLYSFF